MKLPFSLIAVVCCTHLVAQEVTKQVMVEHFTNTRCSTCASRNPGFYGNLNNQQNTNYISVHPSSPYANCPLSQQNTTHNDARTNFYGIFGGTPRLVINGSPISTSVNYAGAGIFDASQNQTTAFQVGIDVSETATNLSIKVRIKKVAESTLSEVLLFAGLIEDTVFVNGGNGEQRHYNVLRRAFTSPQGNAVTLPAQVGDSLMQEFTLAKETIWNLQRLKSVAILQQSDKSLIQSAISTYFASQTTSIQQVTEKNTIQVYPNPARNSISFSAPLSDSSYTLINQLGQVVESGNIENGELKFKSVLTEGVYVLKTENFSTNIQITHE